MKIFWFMTFHIKVTKEIFCVNDILILKWIETETSSEYLSGYSDKAVWPIVLWMPKMSRYVKTFKVKVGDK